MFLSSKEGCDTFLLVVFDPMQGSQGFVGNRLENKVFHNERGDILRQFQPEGDVFLKILDEIRHGALSEVEIPFQRLRVLVPLPMKILRGKPIAFHHFREILDAQCLKAHSKEFRIDGSEGWASTDIVNTTPKGLRYLLFANVGQHSAGIHIGDPFEHAVQGLVKHNRVEACYDFSIQYTGLPERNPIFQTRLDDFAFSQCFGACVVVECANFDRIAHSAPMQGCVPVTGLSDGTNKDQFDLVWVGLRLDGFQYVLNGFDIDFRGQFRIVIGHG